MIEHFSLDRTSVLWLNLKYREVILQELVVLWNEYRHFYFQIYLFQQKFEVTQNTKSVTANHRY